MTPSWFGLLVIVIFLLVLWQLGKRGGTRVAALAACAVILVVLGLFVVKVRVAERTGVVSGPLAAYDHPAPRAVSQVSPEVVAPRMRYLDRSSTDGLEPDVFASLRSAAIASGRALLAELRDVVPDGVELQEVRVVSRLPDLDRAELIEAIRTCVPRARVTFLKDAEAEAPPAEPAVVTLAVKQAEELIASEDAGRSPAWGEGAQTVDVTLSGAAATRTRVATVVSKPWVENAAAGGGHAPDEPLMVADPGTLAATREAALSAAMRRAAEMLQPLVAARAARRPDFSPQLASAERGRDLLQAEIAHGAVSDSFVQRFQRPSGDVYRAFVLLDVSEPQMARLTSAYTGTFSAERTRIRQGLLSGAGLVLVILLVYVFLNAATKGYYVWSLRIACSVLLAAGVAAVVMLA